MLKEELTIRLIRSGDDIHVERTMKQVQKQLECLRRKECVPVAIQEFLAQYPKLKSINMKGLTNRVVSLLDKKDQSKVGAIVREYLQENQELYTVDGSIIKVNANQ